MHRRHALAALFALLATAGSTAIAVLALDLAPGVTHLRGSSYETEFIDAETLGYLVLLYPLAGVAAYWCWWIAVVGVAGIVVPQWLAMNVTMERYADSGWGDGLEVLGYLIPIEAGVVSLLLVLVGGLVGRVRRRRQDQYTTTLSPSRTSANSAAMPS